MIGTKARASRRHCDVYGNSSFTGEMAPIKPTYLLVEGKLHPIEISNTISNVFKLKIENVSCYGRKYCAIFTLPMTSLHKYHEPHARVLWCHNPNPHSIRRLAHFVTWAATKWGSMDSQYTHTTKATHKLAQSPFINLSVEHMAYTMLWVNLDPLPNGI